VTVILDKQPEKYLNSLNEPDFSRITNALEKLKLEPPKGDIIKMQDRKNGYRLRIGDYRVIFHFESEDEKIIVSEIDRRGQIIY